MEDVIEDFNVRVDEINKYFLFLKNIVVDDATLYLSQKRSYKFKSVDDDLHKILKANAFLLVYNLVESSFTRTLQCLCDEINLSGKNYNSMIPEIRKAWLKYEVDYFSKIPKGINKGDYIYEVIGNISEQVLTVPRSLKGIGISGNLDVKKIKDCALIYGVKSEALENRKSNGLFVVKAKRNSLAHGELSFTQCGREYDFYELLEIKKEVVSYMRFVLNLFKSRINSKYYAVE
ncbi:MAE_28990/MAE_18760 family HEPN-like nuclease [Shewanella vaxholmensis]|uniref:MAE_28990/MAE_18760 family HEPN-like nuclease n=1 Tax=Shewanella vaxholmensis TaxID=3063535 RepID=UPI00318EE12D